MFPGKQRQDIETMTFKISFNTLFALKMTLFVVLTVLLLFLLTVLLTKYASLPSNFQEIENNRQKNRKYVSKNCENSHGQSYGMEPDIGKSNSTRSRMAHQKNFMNLMGIQSRGPMPVMFTTFPCEGNTNRRSRSCSDGNQISTPKSQRVMQRDEIITTASELIMDKEGCPKDPGRRASILTKCHSHYNISDVTQLLNCRENGDNRRPSIILAKNQTRRSSSAAALRQKN